MAESSGAEGSRNKRLNFEENEDRISDLPDELIHHILSFLPSTKQAIQTGILSKRWKNQWACVPVLSFDCSGMSSDEDFARSIDNTLLQYDCCKIKKFHLAYNFQNDTNFSSKIRFATRNHVEELILDCCCPDMSFPYSLPEFLFENDSLVKLEMNYCSFECDWTKHWESCLAFNPLAEGPYVIASKSLKILVLVDVDIEDGIDIEIYCPSLEEFSVKGQSDGFACFPRKTIQNVVSGSPLLRLLEVENYYSKQLVIASTSLKRLVLGEIVEESKIELSCPNLEELNLYGYFATLTLTDFPSLICAILDFEIGSFDEYRGENVAKQMLEELDHVKELTMGSWFIEILSDVEMEGLSYSWLNNEALTLNGPNFEYLPGIVCALRSSPILERLVIKLEVYEIFRI